MLLSRFFRVDSSSMDFQIKLSLTFLIGIFCHCFTKFYNRKDFDLLLIVLFTVGDAM